MGLGWHSAGQRPPALLQSVPQGGQALPQNASAELGYVARLLQHPLHYLSYSLDILRPVSSKAAKSEQVYAGSGSWWRLVYALYRHPDWQQLAQRYKAVMLLDGSVAPSTETIARCASAWWTQGSRGMMITVHSMFTWGGCLCCEG